MAGEPRANVIPLHSNSGRGAAARRATAQRADRSRRHPSLLTEPGSQASAEQIASVVREIDQHRGFTTEGPARDGVPNELAKRIAAVAEFVRKRMMGDYDVDEFGFDPHLNDAVFLPLLRVLWSPSMYVTSFAMLGVISLCSTLSPENVKSNSPTKRTRREPSSRVKHQKSISLVRSEDCQ